MDREFELQRKQNIQSLSDSRDFQEVSRQWMEVSARHNYTYNFSWFGAPIIQFPTDVLMMQELIWNVRPDVVLETGVARGGSVCFYASILTLLDLADEQGRGTGSSGMATSERRVIGVDIDMRPHTQDALASFPFRDKIQLIQGSSTDSDTFGQVCEKINADDKCIVILDSNHTHSHVLRELELYSAILGSESFIVVFDTSIEFDCSEKWESTRDWGPGNSPLSALQEFLDANPDFVTVDGYWEKLGITVCPFGIIKRK